MIDNRFGGVIVCGGKSSRMGRPKEWLTLGDKTFLQLTAETLAAVVEPIVIVAAPKQPLPAVNVDVEVRIVRDRIEGQGPLHGIARGLESLPADRVGAYVSGCDAPLLTRGWVSLLLDCLQDNDIAVAQTEGRPHPLAGAYRSSVAQTAHRLVDAARLRPVYLFDEHATVRVSEATLRGVDPDLESLLNANSPEDYAEVRRRFEKKPITINE